MSERVVVVKWSGCVVREWGGDNFVSGGAQCSIGRHFGGGIGLHTGIFLVEGVIRYRNVEFESSWFCVLCE